MERPVRIHVSIRVEIACAASLAVAGFGPENCEAKPIGAGGGVGTNPVMPAPTDAAKVANADSIACAESGTPNALASELRNVAAALATVVDAGTIPDAQLCVAEAHCSAQAAALGGGLENSEVSPPESADSFKGIVSLPGSPGQRDPFRSGACAASV